MAVLTVSAQPYPSFWGWLAVLGVLNWKLHHPDLCLLHLWGLSLCLSSSCKDASHLGLTVHPIRCDFLLSSVLFTLAKTLFPNKVTFTEARG